VTDGAKAYQHSKQRLNSGHGRLTATDRLTALPAITDNTSIYSTFILNQVKTIMAIIKIQRTNDYINAVRNYRLFIDGQKIGTLSNGQRKEFEVSPGRHSLVAKIDWCSSPELVIQINENDSKTFIVGSLKYWKWFLPLILLICTLTLILPHAPYSYYKLFLILPIFLFLLYYLTFGRKKYLTLNEKGTLTA
jgi:hypothetical protein